MHKYLYLVKNMRCIFVPFKGKSLNSVIKFLRKNYRNRCVGIPRWFLEENADLPGKKPFVEIDFLDKTKEQILSSTGPILKTIILSCHYVVPIISVMEFNEIINDKEGTIINFSFSGQLSDRDKKFNIRLGDYAMTDFLIELVEETKNWIEGSSNGTARIDGLLSIREEKIRNDFEKRFWRLSKGGNNSRGKTLIVVYFDPLRYMFSQGYSCDIIAGLLKKFPHLFNVCIMLLL